MRSSNVYGTRYAHGEHSRRSCLVAVFAPRDDCTRGGTPKGELAYQENVALQVTVHELSTAFAETEAIMQAKYMKGLTCALYKAESLCVVEALEKSDKTVGPPAPKKQTLIEAQPSSMISRGEVVNHSWRHQATTAPQSRHSIAHIGSMFLMFNAAMEALVFTATTPNTVGDTLRLSASAQKERNATELRERRRNDQSDGRRGRERSVSSIFLWRFVPSGYCLLAFTLAIFASSSIQHLTAET